MTLEELKDYFEKRLSAIESKLDSLLPPDRQWEFRPVDDNGSFGEAGTTFFIAAKTSSMALALLFYEEIYTHFAAREDSGWNVYCRNKGRIAEGIDVDTWRLKND
ncbi:MAG: hypothetical protein Q8O94_02885 [bacterium]|nr:hypothetical protein [bacterium]